MKTCVLAEKPSQAKEFYLPLIERLSGEKLQRKGSYYESASWYLTWFFGHLFQAMEPVEYDSRYKFWRLEDLPILPQPIQYRYKDPSAQKQGGVILELCNKSDLIVCATDPDREGEGIFRGFFDYHKIDKPVKRLWAVSLTDKDLAKAWQAMKPSTAYDNLARARVLRAGAGQRRARINHRSGHAAPDAVFKLRQRNRKLAHLPDLFRQGHPLQ